MDITHTPGYKAYLEKRKKLFGKVNKPDVLTMSLKELKTAEIRFLEWSKKYPLHPEIEVKTHIYKTYIQPRIQELESKKIPLDF